MLHHLLFINWHPDPEAFHIGPLSIKWYGLLWGLSLFSGYFLVSYVFRKSNKNDEKVTVGIQYVFVFGLIGARLAHILFYQPEYYWAHPEDILAVWKGGLASHGGVVGGLFGLWLFCKRNAEFTFFWTLDHGIIGVMLLASFIRFGNLMNSELYGKPTNVPWAFVFTDVDNTPRHPVVLYESIAYFMMQFFMLYLFRKYKDSKPGVYLATFFTLVFSIRFLLEFLKEPDGAMIGFISKTQALNLPFIIAGLVLFYFVQQGKLRYKQALNG
jgi:phosphatidylglycerol:prolipoprotein diacylglycerol transferase